MGFLSRILGLDTPKAKVSEAEKAQAQLLQAQWNGYQENGIPLERERVAQTMGIRYNPSTKSYAPDPTARRARFNGDGSIRNNMTDSGNSITSISQAYEQRRPQGDTDSLDGDIAQATDEAQAQRQAVEADTTDALNVAGNAAGIAHGAEMEAAQDMAGLAENQAQVANLNAASKFARQSNVRSLGAQLAGMAYSNRKDPSLRSVGLPPPIRGTGPQ